MLTKHLTFWAFPVSMLDIVHNASMQENNNNNKRQQHKGNILLADVNLRKNCDRKMKPATTLAKPYIPTYRAWLLCAGDYSNLTIRFKQCD